MGLKTRGFDVKAGRYAAVLIPALCLAAPAAAQVEIPPAKVVSIPPTDIVFPVPTVIHEGYEPVDVRDGAADYNAELDDAALFSSITGEEIGEVDGLVGAGESLYVELEVGGNFLGLGEKEIVVPVEQLSVTRGEDGYRVYITATEEQLEEYPEATIED